MSTRRIFIGNTQIAHNQAIINDADVLHRLQKVLRIKNGDRLRVFNAQGEEFLAQVTNQDKHSLTLEITEKLPNFLPPKPEICVYQALTKPISKFENVLQKVTELGANGIVPIVTTHTENKNLGKATRLEAILVGASEQCGRSDIPTLANPKNFTEILQNPPHGLNVITHEKETEKTLAQILPQIQKAEIVNIFIGPEGGWNSEEISHALKQGFVSVNLGEIILRTETVAPAILAVIRLS